MEPGLEHPTSPTSGDIAECPECHHHFTVDWNTPENLQEGCPDCGSNRFWREQPSGEPSDGRLMDMPEAAGEGLGVDPGGNPEGTGIRSPILALFNQGECPHHVFGDDGHCPTCGESTGLPSLLQPEVGGDPDAQGVAMDGGSSSLPLDTGNRGRDDGQNHAHVIAALMDDDPYQGMSDRDRAFHEKTDHEEEMARNPAYRRAWERDYGVGAGVDPVEDLERHFNQPAAEHPLGPHTGTKFGNDPEPEERPDLFGEGDPIDHLMWGEDVLNDERFYNHMDAYYRRKKEESEAKGRQYMEDRRLQAEKGPLQTPAHPDPWMDNEPGTVTFPEHWTASGSQHEMIRCPRDGTPMKLDQVNQKVYCPGCGGQLPIGQDMSIQEHLLPWEEYTKDVAHEIVKGDVPPSEEEPYLVAPQGRNFGPAHFGSSGNVKDEMPEFERHSRSMEPYESLWEHVSGIAAPLLAVPEILGAGAEAAGAAGAAAGAAGAEAAGAGAAGAAGGAGSAGGFLGDLNSQQIGGLMKGVMNGAGPVHQNQSGGEEEAPRESSVIDTLLSHYETPASNPDVGTKHDDPEEVDQKEFNDSDKSPKNIKNPETGEPGGATSGEDNATSHDVAFKHDGEGEHDKNDLFENGSPAVERLNMLLPLLLHYFNSEDSGANDPMIKGLHDMLEQEKPGYLDKGDPQHAEILIQTVGQKPHHHATFPSDPNLPSHDPRGPKADPRAPVAKGTCPSCRGAGCSWCHHTGLAVSDQVPDDRPGVTTIPEDWTRHAVVENAGQGMTSPEMVGQQAPGAVPLSQTPPGGQFQTGHCPRCGTPTAGGTCPACGNPAQQPHPQQTQAVPATTAPTGVFGSILEAIVSNHQGPTTPEQISVVQAWLQEHGRNQEVPNVPLDPGNPEYVKILADIQNKGNVPPTVSPEEVTPPPPPPMPPGQEGQPGEPGAGPPGAAGMMQPMASKTASGQCPMCGGPSVLLGQLGHRYHYRCRNCGMEHSTNWDEQEPDELQDFEEQLGDHLLPHEGKVDDEAYDAALFYSAVLAADNVAGECPKCGSHTTGMNADGEGGQHCHACGAEWENKNSREDTDVGSTSIARVAAPVVNQPGGGEGDVQSPLDLPEPQDNGLTWQDSEGEQLEAGKTYVMKSSQYPIPDMIKVMRVKPDGLEVNIMGGLGEQPDPLGHTEHISREEQVAEGLSFEKLPMSADERQQPPPGGGMPGETPAEPTTDEYSNSYPQQATSNVCTKCGHADGSRLTNGNMVVHSSVMISDNQSEHECSLCGNNWITKEESVGLHREDDNWVNPAAEWIRDDDDSWSDTDRQRMMQASAARHGGRTRNIQDIPRDKRAQEVKEYLDSQPKLSKEAGRYFSPLEQRGLIDEGGVARNSDLLQLEGTHYKTSTEEGKLDPDRVPLDHILFGL